MQGGDAGAWERKRVGMNSHGASFWTGRLALLPILNDVRQASSTHLRRLACFAFFGSGKRLAEAESKLLHVSANDVWCDVEAMLWEVRGR